MRRWRPKGLRNAVEYSPDETVSRILETAEEGDPSTAERLLPLVYEELRGLAHHRLAGEHEPQTLQTTALVHEAYLRLVGDKDIRWSNRAHFFGAAARAMRRSIFLVYDA